MSAVTLGGMSPTWAIQNRHAVADTLRITLTLNEEEELIITKISRLLGGESSAAGGDEGRRGLQSGGGVKIDFVIGVSDPGRAKKARSNMLLLSSGQEAFVAAFSKALDTELEKRGEQPIGLYWFGSCGVLFQ